MEKKKNYLNKKYLIERSNELNQLRPFELNLTEIRLFSIYQSKINAREPSKTLIEFSISEFVAIMELKQLNITILKNKAREMMSRVVTFPNDDGGFSTMPLWSKLELKKDTKDEWVITLDCNQYMKPHLFELQNRYFRYELWNALQLKSTNQVRMYEILKQYEYIGTRTIDIEPLKAMLGVEINQYPQYKDFRVRVLDACQKALEENTDINYTYEPIKKARGKIVAIKFTISKNTKYIDRLQVEKYINTTSSSMLDTHNLTEFSSKQDTNDTQCITNKVQMISKNEKSDKISILTLEQSVITKDYIKKQIEYNVLICDIPSDTEIINNIVDIMTDIMTTSNAKIKIGQEYKSSELVRERYLKINMFHINYVVDCLKNSTNRINNIKSYLITMLYNAPATYDTHLAQQVNYDMTHS